MRSFPFGMLSDIMKYVKIFTVKVPDGAQMNGQACLQLHLGIGRVSRYEQAARQRELRILAKISGSPEDGAIDFHYGDDAARRHVRLDINGAGRAKA